MFGGLLFSWVVQMVVVPSIQFLFVVGLLTFVLTIGMILFTHFTPLQILLFITGVVLSVTFLLWYYKEVEEEEDDDKEVDDEHHSVLYRNPFVRGNHVY